MGTTVQPEKDDASGSRGTDARSETSSSEKSGQRTPNNHSFKSSRSRPGSKHGKAQRQTWPSPDKYNQRSLLVFSLDNPIRKFFIAAIEWPWWDRTVLLVILVNTLTLLLEDPYDIPELKYDSPFRTAMGLLSTVLICFFAPLTTSSL